MRLHPPFVLCCLSLALLPAYATQAGDSAQPDREATTLPAVVVSASKRDAELEQLNGAASVASRWALEDAQVASTQELGRVFPELQMAYSGSQLYPQITLRGVTSAQDFYNPALTVYVDGVPQVPTAALQSLLDAEQVELLKGPQGTLYGKSAQGGVLNIVTRQPDNSAQALLRAGVASHRGHQAQANISGPLVRNLLYGAASLSSQRTSGPLHSDVLGSDLGGSRSRAGRLKLRLAPAAAPWELGLAAARDCMRGQQDVYTPFDAIDARTAYTMPGLPEAWREVRQQRCTNSLTGSGQYQWQDWQLSAIASTQRLHLDARQFPFAMQYSWQPEHWRQNVQELRLATRAGAARRWNGVFGLYRQDVRQQRDYTIDFVLPVHSPMLQSHSHNRSETLAAYGDITWRLTQKLDLTGGLRLSRDSARTHFEGHMMGSPVAGQRRTREHTTLGHLAAGYQFSSAWRGYLNLAQGYKPAGYNLAPTSLADAEGFDRERSTSIEAGARYSTDRLRLQLALYRIATRDAQLYGDSQMGTQTLKNVGDTRSSGLELSAQWRASPAWTLAASGFVNQARFRRYSASSCQGCGRNRVPFTPSHGLSLSATGRVPLGQTTLRPQLRLRHTGAHYFDSANALKQKAYTLVDATLAWSPSPQLELSLYAHNLTDKRYRSYGFAYGPLGSFAQVAPGRSLGLTVTWAY
ncbi:TonB-dependent receptor [Comamonadaceae bacterium OH2310_COT-174]|nr:TonB-dependent receptor [Comamonadaceae bacterium OH2310_COT-174]